MNETLNLQKVITGILKELGVSANLKGYYYIRCAVALIVNDSTYINAIVKKLYPAVAREYNTTALRVERAVRHAIEKSWNKGNINFCNELFGYSVDVNKCKPTNSEFIMTIADYIILYEREHKESCLC